MAEKKKPTWLTGEPSEQAAQQQTPARLGSRKGPLAEDETGQLLTADRVRDAAVGRNLTLERLHLGPEDELLGFDDAPDRLVDLLLDAQVLGNEIEQSYLHLILSFPISPEAILR